MVRNLFLLTWVLLANLGFTQGTQFRARPEVGSGLSPYRYPRFVSNNQDSIKPLKDTNVHSPKKATILALALPGSGQIYNRKYWKVPIVYGAFGYAGYSMITNRSKLRTLNDSISGIFKIGKTPTAQLIAERDRYRGNRDVAILSLAGIYVLQAIDATVDAHFYKFNINDAIAISGKISPQQWLHVSIAIR
ncbi:MAG: DUF5683 domain-containing protein [Bacteroidota bacterium]